MAQHPDFTQLSEADQDIINELNSLFLLCKNRSDFQAAVQQIKQHLPFEHWSAALARLEGDYQVTSNYTNIDNFPAGFMVAYVSQAAEFFDVIVSTNFNEQHFGQLQYWKETFEEVEQNKETMPAELYKMHHQWRAFLEEWQILIDGFSLGRRTFFEQEGKWYGSIFNYADHVQDTPRNRQLMNCLMDAQHVAILNIFHPELVQSQQGDSP